MNHMQETLTMKRGGRPARAAGAAEADEFALKVAVVYQDPVTRHWANELWGRVGDLMGTVSTHRESWDLQQLRDPVTFTRAAELAAEADVVVVSVRGAGELPLVLLNWIEAWVPRRAGRIGALVALIGLPPHPDAQAQNTRQYFEAVARQGGLDFLPRERRLPEEGFAPSQATPWLGVGLPHRPDPRRWAVNE
jgi:hypothetical protein